MKPITNNVALVLSFFVYLSFFSLLNAAPNNLVTETCQKVRNKDLCVSSLSAEHASQDATDVTTLALIAIKVASNNGSDTAVFIRKALFEGKIQEPTFEQNFHDCSQSIGDAMQELDDALALILSRDYKNVKTELLSAIDELNTCTSVLNQNEGRDQELFNKANIFLQLCSIAFDIATILASN